MKPAFGQKLIQIVTGNAARDFGVACANQVGIAVAQLFEFEIDFTGASSSRDNALQFGFAGSADAHASAVVKQHIQFLDVVSGAASHLRMHAAGIIADHSAESTPGVRGWVRPKREMKFLRRIAKVVANDARLNTSDPPLRINLHQLVHVFGEIEKDRNIAALAGKTRAAATREDWRAKFSAEHERFLDVFTFARNDDSDGKLPII